MRPYTAISTIILGPLGPLIQRRRNSPGLTAIFVAAYLSLWVVPLQWYWVAALYLLLGVLAFKAAPPKPSPEGEGRSTSPGSWGGVLALAALLVYPILYGYGLFRDIDQLRTFSIYLPASVYVEALVFAIGFGTPGSIALAFLIRRARLRPGIRLLLLLYGGVWVTVAWIGVWEQLHRSLFQFFGMTPPAPPLFFDFYHEIFFRNTMQGVFYAVGVFLGAGYLASAGRGGTFFRRAIFLVLPTALGYANLMLLTGQGGFLLSEWREHLYREGRYPAYRVVAEIEAARVPQALHAPFLMMQLADLASLQGREEEAALWRKKILRSTEDKPYASMLRDPVLWEEKQLADHPGCVSADSMRLLSVPTARPGATLDANWYGLLSAISYLRPDWSDFDLKKRLLEVSPDIQLSAPGLSSIPALAGVLDIFGVPFSPVFLDSAGLHRALNEGRIPFLNVEGRWVSVVGWDPCRRGFLFYRYSDSRWKNSWFNSADREMVLVGREDARNDSAAKTKDVPYNLIGFLPERELLDHLHDIGGVALVLGDSTFASSEERRAAYLAEYGDMQYQEYDDNEGAAEAYARARALHPSDYILARSVHLERRAAWFEGPDYGIDALFRGEILSRPLPTGVNTEERARMARRIENGEMGQYLLLNWHESSLRFFAGKDSAERASSRKLFQTWLRLRPGNPAALDSLAAGFHAESRWDSAEAYDRRLMAYYPMGNERVASRLAWSLFKQDRFEDLGDWLKRCTSQREDARYLLMRGALDWHNGHHRSARAMVKKSLKVDKTLPESHEWRERMALAELDSGTASVSRRWRERTAP